MRCGLTTSLGLMQRCHLVPVLLCLAVVSLKGLGPAHRAMASASGSPVLSLAHSPSPSSFPLPLQFWESQLWPFPETPQGSDHSVHQQWQVSGAPCLAQHLCDIRAWPCAVCRCFMAGEVQPAREARLCCPIALQSQELGWGASAGTGCEEVSPSPGPGL